MPRAPQRSDAKARRAGHCACSAPWRMRTGVDLVAVARVEELMDAQPDLQQRVFTSRELAYCHRRKRAGEHLAGRWAAKEAVLKAIGTGMGPQMEWTDIEIHNDRRGHPTVRLHGEVDRVARSLAVQDIDVSLSHSSGLAVALAVLMCLNPPADRSEFAPGAVLICDATVAVAPRRVAAETGELDPTRLKETIGMLVDGLTAQLGRPLGPTGSGHLIQAGAVR